MNIIGNVMATLGDAAVLLQHITAIPNDWHEGHWFSGPGWYFPDECALLVGPYNTEQECTNALNAYVASLSYDCHNCSDHGCHRCDPTQPDLS